MTTWAARHLSCFQQFERLVHNWIWGSAYWFKETLKRCIKWNLSMILRCWAICIFYRTFCFLNALFITYVSLAIMHFPPLRTVLNCLSTALTSLRAGDTYNILLHVHLNRDSCTFNITFSRFLMFIFTSLKRYLRLTQIKVWLVQPAQHNRTWGGGATLRFFFFLFANCVSVAPRSTACTARRSSLD